VIQSCFPELNPWKRRQPDTRASFIVVDSCRRWLRLADLLQQPTLSGTSSIVVYGERRSFAPWLDRYPTLVVHEYAADPSPDIEKLLQVKEVDCVIPIGGADKAYQAGLAAAVCGKPVFPVGHFGGAAKRIHKLFSLHYDNWKRLPPKELLGILGDAWSTDVCSRLAAQLGLGRKLLIIHGRSPDRDELKKYLQNVCRLPEPVLMREKFGYGKTLPEKWEMVADGIDGAIAVVTPDDVGASPKLPRKNRRKSLRSVPGRMSGLRSVGSGGAPGEGVYSCWCVVMLSYRPICWEPKRLRTRNRHWKIKRAFGLISLLSPWGIACLSEGLCVPGELNVHYALSSACVSPKSHPSRKRRDSSCFSD
jgi:hypothetical protein